MDSELLASMLDFIQEQEYGIHSVTIVRNGYLIADAAIYPFAQGTKHNIHSCTKSITSALIGIAIEQGYTERRSNEHFWSSYNQSSSFPVEVNHGPEWFSH